MYLMLRVGIKTTRGAYHMGLGLVLPNLLACLGMRRARKSDDGHSILNRFL